MGIRVFDFGPRAHMLPGPEELDGFDPTEHLIIEEKAIAELPGHPGSFIRWHPRDPSMLGLIPTTREAIEDHIVRAQRHFQAICTTSGGVLEVPSHRSFVAPNPRDPGKLAIITTVQKIEGISYTSQAEVPEIAPAVYGLTRYLRWVIATGQPEILSDVFNSKQLMTEGHQNYIVDTDAILSSTPKNPRYMQFYVDRLKKWHERLPEAPHSMITNTLLSGAEQALCRASAQYHNDRANSEDSMVVAINRLVSTMSPDDSDT